MNLGFLRGSDGNTGDLGLILGWEDPLEEGMATHSPWTEELGQLTDAGGHKELDTTEQLTTAQRMNSVLSKTCNFAFTLPYLHSQIFIKCYKHITNVATPVRDQDSGAHGTSIPVQ